MIPGELIEIIIMTVSSVVCCAKQSFPDGDATGIDKEDEYIQVECRLISHAGGLDKPFEGLPEAPRDAVFTVMYVSNLSDNLGSHAGNRGNRGNGEGDRQVVECCDDT